MKQFAIANCYEPSVLLMERPNGETGRCPVPFFLRRYVPAMVQVVVVCMRAVRTLIWPLLELTPLSAGRAPTPPVTATAWTSVL